MKNTAHEASGTAPKWLMRVASMATASSASMPPRAPAESVPGERRGALGFMVRKSAGAGGQFSRMRGAAEVPRSVRCLRARGYHGGVNDDFDVLIVGGGLVGASLAIALDGSGLRTALAE